MKKLFYPVIAAVCRAASTSCEEKSVVTIVEDMMYFVDMETYEHTEGWLEPTTKLSVNPDSQVGLLVRRHYFVARTHHPDQTVKIVVDEQQSTAAEGEDFSIDTHQVAFSGVDDLKKQLVLTVGPGAAGKTIVLKLDYEYYEQCKAESRKCDRLTVTVKAAGE